VTDLPFLSPTPDPTRPERKPAKCRRHRWVTYRNDYYADLDRIETRCDRCGKTKDQAGSKRGRNNRKRGTSDELAVARLLGGEKVGPLGLPWDVTVPGYARIQCKKLARWPSLAEVVKWLDAIPAGPELRAVTLADTPGPGGRTRRLIVMDAAEFAAWHGKER
jgi:hypothetical protein